MEESEILKLATSLRDLFSNLIEKSEEIKNLVCEVKTQRNELEEIKKSLSESIINEDSKLYPYISSIIKSANTLEKLQLVEEFASIMKEISNARIDPLTLKTAFILIKIHQKLC